MSGLSTKERAPSTGVGIKMLWLAGLTGGVIAALSTLLGQSLMAPAPLKVATVDVTGLVTGEIARLQETGMDAAKAEAYAHVWGPLLDKAVQDIADEYGVVLLVSPSVVAGAPDLTAVLKERLDRDVAAFQ
ncbi:MAG: TrbI F-type domain-containing protein [Woeseia sp.]